jgi:hypothetical protein
VAGNRSAFFKRETANDRHDGGEVMPRGPSAAAQRQLSDSDRGRIAALAAKLFAAVIDHAPRAHAFAYSEEAVLDATASARKYAVAQARALLAEVDRPASPRPIARTSLRDDLAALRECFGAGEIAAALASLREEGRG